MTLVAEQFMADATAAFGRDASRELLVTVQDWLQDAEHTVPLTEKPTVTLAVAETVGRIQVRHVHGSANPSERNLSIYVHPAVDLGFARDMLPLCIRHELAHDAHYQFNPRFYMEGDSDLFAHVIREGIAQHVENDLYEDYHPNEVLGYSVEKTAKIVDALGSVLHAPEGQRAKVEVDFEEDPSMPRKIYVVGHWLVAQMVDTQNLDYREVMQVKRDDWFRYAEQKV